MKQLIRQIFAFHVSLAYLGMLTGFGMLIFSYTFLFLSLDGAGLSPICRWPLAYMMFILGPGALVLTSWFYGKMHNTCK